MSILSVILVAFATQTTDTQRDTSTPAIPGEVRAALENNAKIFSNLSISGARSQRMLAPAETVLKAFDTRESEAEFTQRIQFELRFQIAKYRESLRYPPSTYHSGTDIRENSFDGTKFFYGDYDPKNERNPGVLIITTPAISKTEGELRKTIGTWARSELWYLLEAGFKGPTEGDEMGRPIESLILARAAAGGVLSVKRVGQAAERLLEVVIKYPEPWQSNLTSPIKTDPTMKSFMDGTDKLQMRIEQQRRELAGKSRLCRFLLDGGKGYAVRERWESREENGLPMFHTKNSDFVQLEPGGAWLPKHCEVECSSYQIAPQYISPKPLYATDIQLEKIEQVQFDKDDFSIWYGDSGIRVQDYTHPKSTVLNPHAYRVASSADALSNLARTSQIRWFIIINVIVISILGLVIINRYRQKRKTDA